MAGQSEAADSRGGLEGKAAWTTKDVEDSARLWVAGLLAGGMPVREIAEEIRIAKSVVHRMKQKIERGAKEGESGEGGGE